MGRGWSDLTVAAIGAACANKARKDKEYSDSRSGGSFLRIVRTPMNAKCKKALELDRRQI